MYFSSKLLNISLFPIMWNEAHESMYHTLSHIDLSMLVIKAKSNLNSEESSSPLATNATCLLDFLFRHFVAQFSNS